MTAQSMWKKSVASRVAAWARRNVRHASSRCAGGGIRCAQVLADGGCRDPVAEPAQLALDPYDAPAAVLPRQAQDQRRELVGDRRASRRLGWRHFAATILLCQRSSVPGVTIRCRSAFGKRRASAASTARSGHVISAWDSPGAGSPPRAGARVSPRPWTPRSGPATPARTAR